MSTNIFSHTLQAAYPVTIFVTVIATAGMNYKPVGRYLQKAPQPLMHGQDYQPVTSFHANGCDLPKQEGSFQSCTINESNSFQRRRL